MINDIQKNKVIQRLEEILCDVIEVEYDDVIKRELFDNNSDIKIDSLSFIRFLVAIEEEYSIEFSEEFLIIEHKNIKELLGALADELLKLSY